MHSSTARSTTGRAVRVNGTNNRFTHHDKHHIERQMGKGVVIERKKRSALENTRLPDSFYDTSAL